MTQTLTTERLKALLDELKSWQYGYDPVDDKEQFDMLATAEWAVIELLANREAQPVALVDRRPAASGSICWQNGGKDLAHGTELFTAPPAPAVPEEMTGGIAMSKYKVKKSNYVQWVKGWNACRDAVLAQPVSEGYTLPDGWIACSERMPEVGEREWRTALPVLVKCEIGVIPAYYGFTYHEGEQCFGFMESIKFGDASGSGPEQHENRLMMHVTHWMPLPVAPEGGNDHDTRR
ncbi:MAG: DUF551 domain-containing protein [Serratia marcescens]|uniref:DUF551 domain-containing protein n=1 Tax=Serratia nevei TaxID=2703794 RepID=UPI00290F4DD0|nr:DUF551 domain-containing protein [Serratia marcescens]